MKEFKIRCSEIGTLMSGTIGLTEAQLSTLKGLEEKLQSGKPLTDKQSVDYEKLIDKRDNPELPKGVQTYLDGWIKDNIIYNRKIKKVGKYTSKGIIMEDEAIDLISKEILFGFYEKNNERKSDEWMEGECDVELLDEIVDIKNSYSHDTFPLLEDELPNSDYDWQMQGYMNLWKKRSGRVIYVLMNLPPHLVEGEIRSLAWNLGYDKDDSEFRQSIINMYNYDDVDTKYRIKQFLVELDESKIEQIKERVKLARKYISEKEKGI